MRLYSPSLFNVELRITFDHTNSFFFFYLKTSSNGVLNYCNMSAPPAKINMMNRKFLSIHIHLLSTLHDHSYMHIFPEINIAVRRNI